MADHAFAGTSGNTSLRSLRERLVAMAQELAEERRHKRCINSSAVTSKRSSCIPVLDGSVLKNDIKQQLAKERREESKRQQEANKEKQLLEKQQKAKLQYEKQLEERHRKLKEQKEKDERRRVSAEKKRKQKQAEDKEKFKAVVSRTMERCNRVDQQQKRWSWEGGAINRDKSGKTEIKRSSSLNKKDNQSHPNVDLGHVGHMPGTSTYIFRHVTVPMFTSDEIKSAMSRKMPVPAKLETTPTNKVEIPLKEDVENPVKVNAESPLKMNMEETSQANVDGPSKANVKIALHNMDNTSETRVAINSEVDSEVLTDVNSTRHPESNIEELPMNVDTSSSVEPSPIVSQDSSSVLSTESSSFMSVEISPIVSLDTSPEASVDTSPALSMGSASAVTSEGNLETFLRPIEESTFEESMEAKPETNIETSSKNSEVNKRNTNYTTEKLPSHIPCYRWPSSTSLVWRPPSPMKSIKQNKKIRPPSPLPVSSRLSKKTSLSYKITPVQNVLYVPNALSMITKKKEITQKHMIDTESVSKSVPSSESAVKASVEIQHAINTQKGIKERGKFQKETRPGESHGMAEKVDEVPAEEFSEHKDEQQEKDVPKKHFEPAEDQKGQLQKGANSKMRSQDSAAKRKSKEQERLMLQLLQERLERKKRVEEIMKRTRKTDVNSSKASALSDNCPSEEGEADDEGETESDEDLFDFLPAGIKASHTNLKKFYQNANRRPQKLVFLQAGSGEIDTEKKVYFNGDIKVIKQDDPRESAVQAKGTKVPNKKTSTRKVRSRKPREAKPTFLSSLSVPTNQEWICDKIIDLSHAPESPVKKTPAGSNKQNSKDSMTTHQGPQAPLDHKKRGKHVSAPLTKVLSQLHIAGGATTLENPLASGCSEMAFGGEEDDSDK